MRYNVRRAEIRPGRNGDWAAFLVGMLALAFSSLLRAADGPALTSADQVRRLPPEEAKLHQPVVLRGVVTYHDAAWKFFFMQDATDGVFVHAPAADFPLVRGQQIELTGITVPGGFSSGVDKPSIRVLGDGPLPEARAATIPQVASGELDAQWVEVRGVVCAIRTVQKRGGLHLHADGQELNVVFRDVAPSDPQLSRLVDAVVRVRGVNGANSGPSGKLKNVRLLVPDLDDVIVEKAAPEKPYTAPATFVASVAPAEHRVKLFGRVINVATNGSIVLADKTGEIELRPSPSEPVRPGDMAEALGFPERDGEKIILDHTVFRLLALRGNTNATSTVSRLELPASPYLPLLQHIQQVRSLQPEEAALEFPVRVRGMVTFYSPGGIL